MGKSFQQTVPAAVALDAKFPLDMSARPFLHTFRWGCGRMGTCSRLIVQTLFGCMYVCLFVCFEFVTDSAHLGIWQLKDLKDVATSKEEVDVRIEDDASSESVAASPTAAMSEKLVV